MLGREHKTSTSETDQVNWQRVNDALSEGADQSSVKVLSDWQAGSESYILDLMVKAAECSEQDDLRCIVKACVKVPCTATMQEWLGRRSALESSGVSTPQLYFYDGKATLIEEYIPYSIEEAYQLATSSDKATIVESLARTYARLSELRFSPRIMHDLRSRGNDVVVIDFGEDLGAQYNDREPSKTNFDEIVSRTLGGKALNL